MLYIDTIGTCPNLQSPPRGLLGDQGLNMRGEVSIHVVQSILKNEQRLTTHQLSKKETLIFGNPGRVWQNGRLLG